MRNKEIKTISMESVVRNAITKGITIENVAKSEDVERRKSRENKRRSNYWWLIIMLKHILKF